MRLSEIETANSDPSIPLGEGAIARLLSDLESKQHRAASMINELSCVLEPFRVDKAVITEVCSEHNTKEQPTSPLICALRKHIAHQEYIIDTLQRLHDSIMV